MARLEDEFRHLQASIRRLSLTVPSFNSSAVDLDCLSYAKHADEGGDEPGDMSSISYDEILPYLIVLVLDTIGALRDGTLLVTDPLILLLNMETISCWIRSSMPAVPMSYSDLSRGGHQHWSSSLLPSYPSASYILIQVNTNVPSIYRSFFPVFSTIIHVHYVHVFLSALCQKAKLDCNTLKYKFSCF